MVMVVATAFFGDRLPLGRRCMSRNFGIFLEGKLYMTRGIRQAEVGVDGIEKEGFEKRNGKGSAHVSIRRVPRADNLQDEHGDNHSQDCDASCGRFPERWNFFAGRDAGAVL